MQGGNPNLRGPKWGPLVTCTPPDSSKIPQDFHGVGQSFLSRANGSSPHHAPAWEVHSPRWREQVAGQDLHWGSSPPPPGVSPRGHLQHQRGMRSVPVHSVQGSYGYSLNGTPRRGVNPSSPSVSPLNGFEQHGGAPQDRGRHAMVASPETPSGPSPPQWGEGPRRRKSGDDKLGLAERTATRVYNELLGGGQGVSTRKVAQGTLSVLGVPSFETMGVMPQDIPCLRKLSLLEGKVNAFVHSHVAGKKITTLHDLTVDLTRDEGVKEFEDLGLGPLLCHSLIAHYFSPPVGAEVHKITAGEVIQLLSDYLGNLGKDTRVQIESFLDFIAKERSLPTPQHLCIRIQSLGMHIGFIRRAKKAEKELISIWESRAKAEFDKKQKPSVMERVNSFLGEQKKLASLGKRKFARFSIEASPGSDDDINDAVGVEVDPKTIQQKNKSRNKVEWDDIGSMTLPVPVTTCPYPSAAEECARIKKQELRQFVANSEQEDFYLSFAELQEFVTILKDACENRSVHEVLMKMIEMSRKFKGTKKRSGKSKIFKAYPAIGLLNVAVLSVKAGFWDSMCKNFLCIADETKIACKDELRSVQAPAPIDVDVPSRPSTPDQKSQKPVPQEVVAAISEHYDGYLKQQVDHEGLDTQENHPRAWWSLLHWGFECEKWIAGKYSVGLFSCLGFGSFPYFLQQNIDLLPNLMIGLFGESNGSGSVQKSPFKIPKERVVTFLGQALPTLSGSGSLLQEHISGLLYQQFKVSNLQVLGANSIEELLQNSKDEQSRLVPSNHVFFLSPLIRSGIMGEVKACLMEEDTASGVLGIMTSADAMRCLSRAPMLADLHQWSQWQSVFAPTLGPLLDWFENEGSQSGLHAIVTCEGALLRIDGTANVESFLIATVEGHGDKVAAVLTSLVAVYGGISNAPTALLKSHASKGLEILMGSSGSGSSEQTSSGLSVVRSTKRKFMECFEGQPARMTRPHRDPNVKNSAELKSLGDCATSRRIGSPKFVASQCVIECLSCLIPELRIFAAEILLPALSPLIAGSHAVLLSSCVTSVQKSILHGVGLVLGIPEWTTNYKSSVFGLSKPLAPLHNFGPVPAHIEVEKTSAVSAKGAVGDIANTNNFEGCIDSKNRKGLKDIDIVTNVPTSTVRTQPNQQMSGKDGVTNTIHLEKVPLESQAIRVIEEIRRYEFGMGEDIEGNERDLLARQHARMGRALHRLSSDLYSQDSHFVLELVQNADDNSYNPGVEAAVIFLIQEKKITVLNNEAGFTAANMRALCDVGNSTKVGTNTGYIGHKGIGFKSVFRVTDSPEIHSNGFHVKFDVSEGDLGFILPTCILAPSESLDDMRALLSKIEMPQSVSDSWNTQINLPIKASLLEGPGMSLLAAKFNDLHPSLLLFLHHLRCIAVHNEITSSTIVMYREDIGNGLVKVMHDKGTTTWMVVRRQLIAGVHRAGITDTEIALAFQLTEMLKGTYEAHCEQQQVFAFLPLRAYGLRFIVQGDFKVPSSREEVDCDSDWNQWLRSEIPDVFIQAATAFQKLIGYSDSPGKAISNFMSFVPMEGEVLGFFSPLPRMILSGLRRTPCLPVEGGGWALPCVLLRGWSSSSRQLLPDVFLNEHIGLCYLDKEVVLPDTLALKLGVQKFGAGTLVAVMKSVCLKKGALETLGLKWVEAWLLALHGCFESDQHSHQGGTYEDRCSPFRLELQSISFIPLSNGTFTSLAAGPVWFAGESFDDGVNSILKKFSHISSELRTVHPDILYLQDESVMSDESAGSTTSLSSKKNMGNISDRKVVTILQALGVRRIFSHDVLKNHVIPAMFKDDCLVKDQILVVEYLGFVMSHLESRCITCSSDISTVKAQLQKCAIILTSSGLTRAKKCPIHFGPEMGNPITDMKKILDGTNVSWIEVSPLYLQLQPDPSKWRSFFKDLGVTDFVEVIHTEEKLLDESSTKWKTSLWEEEGGQEGPWIVEDWHSPELAQILVDTDGLDSAINKDQRPSFGQKERLASVLAALNQLWDDYYYQFCEAIYAPLTGLAMSSKRSTVSSFKLLLQRCAWVMSSVDEELRVPTDLFQRCDAVQSILGSHAPYVAAAIQSESLMKALGLRTEVFVDDALQLLQYWSHSKGLFEASVAQMSRLYMFLWEKLPSRKQDILSVFRSSPCIFIPLHSERIDKEVQRGVFYPNERVCWSDPTHTIDLVTLDREKLSVLPVCPLDKIYHGLWDFFVGERLVQEKPSFDGYLEVLQKVSTEQRPSTVHAQIMQVFCVWSSDISLGRVEPEEILRWRKRLEDVNSCVFPTNQDKWVALNDQTGLVCVCDDEKLGEEFMESLGCIHFLLMRDDDLPTGSKNPSYQQPNRLTLEPLLQALCIPKLSEVVVREVLKYGLHDNGKIEALIGWVLPYAQRYLRHQNMHQYNFVRGTRIRDVLKSLQFVVADQLFFQYSLRNSVIRSKNRKDCTCILEGNTLHVVGDFGRDYCNIYAELSRLFFCGKSNIPMANFLHLITLMASSGSPENEVESFILNVQGIGPIPKEDDLWTLGMKLDESILEQSPERERMSAGYYLERHVNHQNLRKKSMQGFDLVGWPPNSWKPLATVEGGTVSTERIKQMSNEEGQYESVDTRFQAGRFSGYPASHGILASTQNQVDTSAYGTMNVEKAGWDGETRNRADECIDGDVSQQYCSTSSNFKEGRSNIFQTTSEYQEGRHWQVSQDTGLLAEPHHHMMDMSEVVIDGLASIRKNMGESLLMPNFQGRDFLVTHPVSEQQRELTGRYGEALVFQYLCRHYGSARVKWLNQDLESGAAYDIVIRKGTGQEEFVEVKATRSGAKDWFEISPREWEFARNHAESFTIMRVFLGLSTQQAKLLRLPNPVKLAQDRIIQLALLLPDITAAQGVPVIESMQLTNAQENHDPQDV